MTIYVYCLYAILAFALCGWLVSLATDKHSHVDSMWGLFMLIAATTTALFQTDVSPRGWLVLVLTAVWALRLSAFITWRNWGHEDYRYETIRRNNEPYFWFKSLYIVFVLQAVLAWLVAYPLYSSLRHSTAWSLLDALALIVWLTGFYWEVVADVQLAKFKSAPENAGRVLNRGLWRYSRHPNYFGECLVWWGFALFAFAAGDFAAVLSAGLMTLLLLKVSGVALLEKTITERRPEYAQYIASTNAFIPGIPNK